MHEVRRKYGVIIAHQDFETLGLLLDYVKNAGASVVDIGQKTIGINKVFYCNEWDVSGSNGNLAGIVTDIDLFLFHTKKHARRWLREKTADSIDLVLMDHEGTGGNAYIDGYEAALYMREHGYGNCIAVHSPAIDPVLAKNSGIDEAILKNMSVEEMMKYVVQRYHLDRPPIQS